MTTSGLNEYIREAHDAGLSEEDIIINLINAGWDAGDVDGAVGEILYSKKSKELKRDFIQKRKSVSKMPLTSYMMAILFVGGLLVGGVALSSRLFVSYLDGYSSLNNLANVQTTLLEQKKQNILKNKETKLLFVGDIMLSTSRGTGKQIKENNDYKYPFLKIAKTLRSADLTFGNLEGPISSRGKNLGGKYSFRADPRVIEGLKFAGFDVMSVANNHIFDWGRDAFEDTVSNLKLNNISPVGGGMDYSQANNPVVKTINGTKIAFLAYSTVSYDANSFNAQNKISGKSLFDKDVVLRTIKQIKDWGVADIVVVSFHWGDEYKTRSHKKQQDISYALINAGADIIIGHHPHVVQEVERYKNGWIAYSLGNFIFDQSFSKDTMNGLMLDVTIRNRTIVSVNPIDITISDTFQPSLTKSREEI